MVTISDEKRLRLGPVIVLLAGSIAASTLFWDDLGTSYWTTWELAATGVERFHPAAVVTLWASDRGLIVPGAAGPLALAPLGWPVHDIVILLLALLWATGTRRLARAAGAGETAATLAGVGSAFAAVTVAKGDPDVLGAGALVWTMAAGVGTAGSVAAAAGAVLLAFVSRSGLALAPPLLVGLALWSGSRREGAGAAVPAGITLVAFWCLPRPAWTNLLLQKTPWMFGDGAPYGVPTRGFFEILELPFTGGESIGPAIAFGVIILWVAALVGGFRGGSPGRRLLVLLLLLGAVAAGPHVPGFTETTGIEGPAAFLFSVVPALAVHSWSPSIAALSSAFILALAAAAWKRGGSFLAAAGIALVLTAHGMPAGDVPPRPAAASFPGDGRMLALPLSVADDQAWQRVTEAGAELRNGTQSILEANAPVLTSVLGPDDSGEILRWARRLGMRRLILPARDQAEPGTSGGWRIVDVPESPVGGRRPCLPEGGWRVRSSRGHPEVSVPDLALDGHTETRWGTGAPQRPGQFFEILLERPQVLHRLELDQGPFTSDYPRGFRVLVRDTSGSWRQVVSHTPWLGDVVWNEEIRFAHPAGPRRSPVTVRLGGVRASGVRVELTRKTERWDWSIAEVCLRGEVE